MSKGIKVTSWVVIIMALASTVVFGVLAYQNYKIMKENLIWEERFGLYLDGWIDEGYSLYDEIVEGHEVYTTAFILFTNYTLIGGSILVGTGLLQFVLNLANSKRRN